MKNGGIRIPPFSSLALSTGSVPPCTALPPARQGNPPASSRASSASRRSSPDAAAQPLRPASSAECRRPTLYVSLFFQRSSCASVWFEKLFDITKLGWPVAQPRFTSRPSASTKMLLPSREGVLVHLRLDVRLLHALRPRSTAPSGSRCRSGRCCTRSPGPSSASCAQT